MSRDANRTTTTQGTLTVKEMAADAGFSIERMRVWCAWGKVPGAYSVGDHHRQLWRISRPDWEAFKIELFAGRIALRKSRPGKYVRRYVGRVEAHAHHPTTSGPSPIRRRP